ncbi:hypothetical protein NPIL_629141 [Nephila pilipes]|uniref:Uncharacterized protein n=1 Tax=Nephila pilipes TaxID=299642 RepID=A0A8X6TG70_NEPPI|nr:hypothetical protein NPIL_629141 [Nephila pilipes]
MAGAEEALELIILEEGVEFLMLCGAGAEGTKSLVATLGLKDLLWRRRLELRKVRDGQKSGGCGIEAGLTEIFKLLLWESEDVLTVRVEGGGLTVEASLTIEVEGTVLLEEISRLW